MAAADPLSLEKIRGCCRGTPLEQLRVFYYPRIDSTNLEARRAFQKEAEEFSVYVADEQTSGRGSHGKSWHSPPGLGLYFSVLLRPAWNPAEGLHLTQLAALAAFDALSEILGSDESEPRPMKLRIKPPNDLLLNARKVCGILVESASAGASMLYAVAGFGINVSHRRFPPELAESATSLLLESGSSFDRARLLCGVLKCFHAGYDQARREGWSRLRARWSTLAGDGNVS